MSTISNIILIGATGNVGPSIINALQRNPNFNITVLSREGSKSSYTPPHGVRSITADYSSHSDLVAAFTGQDAVVSTVGFPGIPGQIKLIDAAIEAGVQRFIPSEFGSDSGSEKLAPMVFHRPKNDVRQYLREKASEGKITWTSISTGPFFDWGLKSGFIGFNIAEKKAIIYDGGSRPFSTTNIAEVGTAVFGALSHPEETKNRNIYVHSAAVKQRDILAIYERLTGSKWETEHKDTAELEKAANLRLAQGDSSTIYHLVYRGIFGEGYGGEYKNVDNEIVGVKVLDEAGIEEVIKNTL